MIHDEYKGRQLYGTSPDRTGQFRPYREQGMKRRAHERVDVNMRASIYCSPYLFDGKVRNVSEKGICMHTMMCFPKGTECKLMIAAKERVLELNACVTRLEKRDGFNDTMGFVLLNPPPEYIELVESLRQSL